MSVVPDDARNQRTVMDKRLPETDTFPRILTAWERHEAELRRYLMHNLSDVHLADDVVQDVFLKALSHGDRFCDLNNTRAWLFQVARNALIDTWRRARPTVPLPEGLVQEENELPPVDALAECLPRVLTALSAEDREILQQCDLDGVKQQVFADKHGLSLAAAKSRLLRARRRMREWMIRHCEVGFDDAGAVCCHTPASPD